jgi:hypothetical protein
MHVDGKFYAPSVDQWRSVAMGLPPPFHVVMGIVWVDEGFPMVRLLRHDPEDDVWLDGFSDEQVSVEPWAWSFVDFDQPVTPPFIDPEVN